jgi:hypothetical protein
MRRALIVLCLAGAVAACAQSGYDPSKLQKELQHAHLTPEQSRCVTNGLEQAFDPLQLGSHSKPTAKEESTTRDILVKCGIKLS